MSRSSTLLWLLLAACDTPTESPTLPPDTPDTPDSDTADSQEDTGEAAAPPVRLRADGTGDYPTIAAALAAGETDLLLESGDYYIDEAIELATPNTTLRGADRSRSRLIATRNDQDLIISRADGSTVDNLTLDTEEHGAAAFVQAGSANTTLSNCTILGNDRIFTVFFAGPVVAAGDETLASWRDDQLSVGNAILGNDIRSSFVGDSVVFALQSDGEVRDNTVRDGMLAVYMTRRVTVSDNLLQGSRTQGLFLSLPASDTTISSNTFRSSRHSAISIRPQLEHAMAGQDLASTGIRIDSNDIEAEYSGIEIDGNGGDPSAVRLVAPVLVNNEIRLDDFMGVYVIRAEAPELTGNTITFVGDDTSRSGVDGRANIASSLSTGIALVLDVDGAVVTDNTITREAAVTDMSVMQNAVRLELESVRNTQVSGNTFTRYTDDWLHSPCEADGGEVDADGVYDTTAAKQKIGHNACSVGL